MSKDIKYIKESEPILEKSNDKIRFGYVGNGVVIASKEKKFKVVSDFKDEESEETKIIVNEDEPEIYYAEEVFLDDDLYGAQFKDTLLESDSHRSFVDIADELNSAILENGVETNFAFELLASMQFSRIMLIPNLEDNLKIMKSILRTFSSYSFIFNKEDVQEINRSEKLAKIFEVANKNKSNPVFIYLHEFESETFYDFIKSFYAYFDNPDGDNYINTFGKLNYIPHNIYFLLSLKEGDVPYLIKRKLLRYISKMEYKAKLVEEKAKFKVTPISLEELSYSEKEASTNFAFSDDLWKKVDGLVNLISKTNGYFIHNKIEVRLENYLVAYSQKISDSYELLDTTLANNFALEAFICKDPSLYTSKIDIETYINNAFGYDRMLNLRKEFTSYLNYALKEGAKEWIL